MVDTTKRLLAAAQTPTKQVGMVTESGILHDHINELWLQRSKCDHADCTPVYAAVRDQTEGEQRG